MCENVRESVCFGARVRVVSIVTVSLFVTKWQALFTSMFSLIFFFSIS